MERREPLQTPADEQSRLPLELPKVIADDLELETAAQDFPDDKREKDSPPVSTLKGTSGIPSGTASNGKLPNLMPSTPDSDYWHYLQGLLNQPSDSDDASAQIVNVPEKNGYAEERRSVNIANTQVIDISDDEEHEDSDEVQAHDDEEHEDSNEVQAHDDVSSLMWHYADPQGYIQGPFSLKSLKRWKDADYFPQDIKVWKKGQNRGNAVLLTDILGVNVPEKDGYAEEQRCVNISNTQVIDISDDEEHGDSNEALAHDDDDDDDVSSLMWHYTDPQEYIQGPFSLKSLKDWKDADYFPQDFKVWKTGQKRGEAVLLSDVLRRMFPI